MKSWLFLLSVANAAAVDKINKQDVITDETYFYGLSPPVYPSPEMAHDGPWAEARAKAGALVSQMTLEEMANITVGYPPPNRCSGLTGSVPRLNWPGICTTGAGNGIRQTDFVNGWPAAIGAGASFNKNLTHARGVHMGREFRAKGSNLAGGPVVGPLGRIALHGRNWEGFSNDPYLAGALAAETVLGIQSQGVQSMTKHFVGYEQQLHRLANYGDSETISVNMDDRTMHEIYLWPFQDAVHAGAASIMCSYNRLNGSSACQNSKALNGYLKTELGFQGWVISDWGAQHGGLASAEAGLDVAMPNSLDYWGTSGGNLTASVRNGSLPEARLRDMATRIIGAWYHLGQDKDYPTGGIGMPRDFTRHEPVLVNDPESKKVILDAAIESHVLVKNIRNALPLKKPKMLSIFGYDAPAPPAMNVPMNYFESIQTNGWIWGTASNRNLSFFLDILLGKYKTLPAISPDGTLISGAGSGATAPKYVSSPFDAISHRAYDDNTAIFYDFHSVNPAVNDASDACLVFINAFAGEGADRPTLYDDYSDALVKNVAANCSNTIVTIHNAGIRLVDQWVDHENVTALIFAHLPGQDSGRALVKILYGDVSPSGKLPYTVGKNESDYEALSPDEGHGKFARFPQSNFDEGVFVDYKHYDRNGIAPRYEFGFGLSYSTFEYSELSIKCENPITPGQPKQEPIRPGGNPALWESVVTVAITVTNTGDVDAAEAAQLYLGIPGEDTPVRQLRGFGKAFIRAGEASTYTYILNRRDLSVWDAVTQDWILREGEYNVFVGKSSRDLPLHGTFAIGTP
ncbi:hypothetical protein DL770_002398 [Monosporascus sp. CRB-9-2]|nr:hypothetical protein DL770_002398 [Monosporascus sp. CRB-9-2]